MIIGSALSHESIGEVKLAVYSHLDQTITDEFLTEFRDKNVDVLIVYDLETCKQKVIDSDVHGCIEVTKAEGDFGEYDKFVGYDVTLYVDFSKQSTVWEVINRVQWVVDVESDKVRDILIEDLEEDIDEMLIDVRQGKGRVDQMKIIISQAKNAASTAKTLESNLNSQISLLGISINTFENDLNQAIGLGLINSSISNKLTSDLLNIKNNYYQLNLLVQTNQLGTEIDKLNSELIVIENEIDTLSILLDSFERDLITLKEVNFKRIVNPIQLTPTSISSSNVKQGEVKELKTFDYLFPTFLFIFILFMSLIFSATFTIRERSSSAYIRNILGKVGKFRIVFGELFFGIFLVVVQTAILIIIASNFLSFNLFSNWASLVFIVLLSIFVFCLLGVLIGNICNSQESAIMTSVCLAVLFLIFMPLITPIEVLPILFAKVLNFTPLLVLESKLRVLLMYNIPLMFNLIEIIALGGFVLVMSFLLWFFVWKFREYEF